MTYIEQLNKKSVVFVFRNLAVAASAALVLIGFAGQQAKAQSTWATTYASDYSVGGVSTRETPAAAVFNGVFEVAYTNPPNPTSICDQYTNCPITILQCSPTSCTTVGILYAGTTEALTNANPAVAVVGGTVYVAYITEVGPGTGSGDTYEPDATMYITSSTSGTGNWTAPVAVGTLYSTNVRYSPTMISYNSNLYIGWNAGSNDNNYIGLCVSATPTLDFSCGGPTENIPAGYQPGLAVYNSTLYMGYVTSSLSHDVYYITSPISTPFSFSAVNDSLDGNQSSTAPHLEVWDGVLNFDMRTNDDAHKFSQRYSSNGSSWSSWPDAHIAMEGEPFVVPGTGLAGADANYNYLFYATNSSMYFTIAQGN